MTPPPKDPREGGTTPGIPLDRLREHQRALRAKADAEGRQRPEEAAPEDPITQESTSRVARQVFQSLPPPMHGEADPLDQVLDKLAAGIARRVANDTLPPPNLKPNAFGDWSKFILGSIGVVALVLGSWWGLANMMRDRPTTPDVKEMLAPHEQKLKELDAEQRTQREAMIRVGGTLDNVNATLKDLKDDAKAPKAVKHGR